MLFLSSSLFAFVILGAALALPSYLSYEAFYSLTKHRFLCNLTRLLRPTADPLLQVETSISAKNERSVDISSLSASEYGVVRWPADVVSGMFAYPKDN